METATLFTVGFHNKIPTGALLLNSDSPMTPEGVKTLKKDEINSRKFDKKHIEIGISSLKKLLDNAETVRHLKF
jgi:AMP nucleosidase